MQKLYCFDVDGTLLTEEMDNESDYVKGIIKTDSLLRLEEKGHQVVVVSPSPYLNKRYRDKHWVKDFESNDQRHLNVKKAMEIHSFTKEQTIYIDDGEELRKQVKESLQIKTLSPEEFLLEIESIKV